MSSSSSILTVADFSNSDPDVLAGSTHQTVFGTSCVGFSQVRITESGMASIKPAPNNGVGMRWDRLLALAGIPFGTQRNRNPRSRLLFPTTTPMEMRLFYTCAEKFGTP